MHRSNSQNLVWTLVLGLCCSIIYAVVFFELDPLSDGTVMFSSPDSREYLSTSTEFHELSATGHSRTRPFLYPLLLRIMLPTLGTWGISGFQALMWLGSVLLLFDSIRRFTKLILPAFMGGILLALNFSFIAVTFHGITETTTIFLITLLIHQVVASAIAPGTLRSFHGVVLLLSLLTVLKPLFLIPLLITLFIIIPLFFRTHYFSRPHHLFILALALSPVTLQVGIMKVKYDEYAISTIGTRTFREYFLTQGISRIDTLPREVARDKANLMPRAEIPGFILQHRNVFCRVFLDNLHENVHANPIFLLSPAGHEHWLLAHVMLLMNRCYMVVHLLFALPMLLILAVCIRKKAWRSCYIPGSMHVLFTYIILISTISHLQGDRLVLPALPLFIFTYMVVTVSALRILGNTFPGARLLRS